MFTRRFRAFRQLQASDCGITCIRMIARAYGKDISVKYLRNLTEVNKLGISLLKNADRILYMSDGKILEDGTHEELIALKGKYFELVSNQLEILE